MTKNNKNTKVFSPAVNIILFDMLLIITPFLMVTNYLQTSIRELSHLSFSLFDINIPIILSVVIVLGLIGLIPNLGKLSTSRAISLAYIIIMVFIGHNVSDYYLDLSFFDLQQNWHYIAYGLFAFVMYRALKHKNLPYNKLITIIFFKALVISAIDEGFQYFISNRIFDLCDIAKDSFGSVMGIIFVLFFIENGRILDNFKNIRNKKIGDYFRNPISLLFIYMIFAIALVSVSSFLTDTALIFEAVSISLAITIVLLILIHLTTIKIGKYAISVIGALVIISVIYSAVTNSDSGAEYSGENTILHRGLPIIYFDVMLYSDGWFRLVDKKDYFNSVDLQTILKKEPDILIFSKGKNNIGGQGLEAIKSTRVPQFIYNPNTGRGTQLAILENKKAIEEFNRLKKNNKNVILIYHH